MQVPLVARGAGMMTPRQSFTAARAELPGQTNNVVALSRSQNASLAPIRPSAQSMESANFMAKVKAAWAIFFPAKPEKVSAGEAGKSRLRMILVADRCGMNQTSMYEMRHSIVKAVSDFVEIEGEEMVEVNISNEPDLGTVYSVAVPVRRVKAQARFGSEDPDGTSILFDDDEDQSHQFPYGC
jgi:septum formation topological specificity factor MinE